MNFVRIPRRCAAAAGREWVLISPKEAEHVVMQDLAVYVGFLTKESEERGLWLCKRGHEFHACPGFTLHMHKPRTAPKDDLFEDSLIGEQEATMRPGRGEGLGDDLEGLCLFGSVSPNDIRPGEPVDRWLVSSLAVMANFPAATMDLIEQKTFAQDGKYDVRLFHPSLEQWSVVTVDDRLPVHRGTNKLKYTKLTDEAELWPCIVEKAVAKLFGGYHRMQNHVPSLALKCFTGCMGDQLLWISRKDRAEDAWLCRYTNFEERPSGPAVHDHPAADWPDNFESGMVARPIDEVYALLLEFDEQNFIMCACSADSSTCGADGERADVTQSHLHTILQILSDAAGSGIDLLQLHNPWGEGEWRGDWSDLSKTWDSQPQVKDLLKPDLGEDGTFWISKRDFARTYASVYISRISMDENRTKDNKRALRAEELRHQQEGLPPAIGQPKKETIAVRRRRKQGDHDKESVCCGEQWKNQQLALSGAKPGCLQC